MYVLQKLRALHNQECENFKSSTKHQLTYSCKASSIPLSTSDEIKLLLSPSSLSPPPLPGPLVASLPVRKSRSKLEETATESLTVPTLNNIGEP
jgi:hypothetical protein